MKTISSSHLGVLSTPFNLVVLVLVTVGLLLTACGDDPTSSEEDDDPTEEFVLEGEVNDYDRGEQRVWANSGLAEGTLEADGSFTVTLFGLEEIEDELTPVDPEASGFDGFQGFACDEQIHAEIGSDIRFASIAGFAFDADDLTYFGLTSQEVDRTWPLPLEEGTHVRWIFAEESVEIDAECRDGDRTMSLDLKAGWNEVVIETERPSNDWFHDQFTGDRPDSVDWVMGE